MAIYSTLFVAERGAISAGFPGWKEPLRAPRKRVAVNPFTREKMVIESTEPDWDGYDPAEAEPPEFGVKMIAGDYAQYLESRIPPWVRAQPHECLKGIMGIELGELVKVLIGGDTATLPTALYSPPDSTAALDVFPDAATARLRGLADLGDVARQWATAMSHPDHTHSATGTRLEPDWTEATALSILEPLHGLAQRTSDGSSVYLLVEV